MAELIPVKSVEGRSRSGNNSDFISGISGISGEGYRQDISRSMSNLIGNDNDSISSKEEGYQRDNSRDLEEIAEEEGVASGQNVTKRPPIARKRVKQRVNPSEEETQIIPLSLGRYVDHSLDPVIDEPAFAPMQRQPNFPETLFAILSNESLSDIITWMPHGRSFTVLDRSEFVRNVLPVYFRASKIASFSKQLNGYDFTKIKLDANHYTYYHPFFLRGLPHLVKNIKRNATGGSSAKSGHVTEADLERLSAEAPVPHEMNASYASSAIQRINHQYELNRLQVESSEQLQQAQASVSAPYAPFPDPQYSSSSNVPNQLGVGPTLSPPVNYQPMLAISTSSTQHQNMPPMGSQMLLGAYLQPQWGGAVTSAPTGWDGVTQALLQAFQTAQVQRQLQDQANRAQLNLLANALAADLQNIQHHHPYPLTPSQLLSSAITTLNSVQANIPIPATIYTPQGESMVQPPRDIGAQQTQQQMQQMQQMNDGSNYSKKNEQNENDNEQNM